MFSVPQSAADSEQQAIKYGVFFQLDISGNDEAPCNTWANLDAGALFKFGPYVHSNKSNLPNGNQIVESFRKRLLQFTISLISV